MNNQVSFLFYIKRAKANKDGLAPIYVRVTINAKRFEFSTNKFVHVEKWSSESSRAKGFSEESRLINNYLDETFTKLILVEKSLIKKDMPVTRESFKNELFGIHQNIQIRTLIPIFQDHNSRMKILVGQEFAKSTHKRYETSLKHTQDFLLWKFKASDIELEKIDHAFICDYEFYLRSVRKCGNNSAVKYIKNFKKIVRLCLANGWISLDPFANYKSKVKEVERVYLTQEELQKIMDKKIIGDRLGIVRDLFLFSCFTGLAYIDLKNLTPNHISKGIDGDLWIFTNRQKTESASKIPLLPIPKGIINKYQDHPQCEIQGKLLPVPSNQKMNAYLKEIADISQINKELTFHIARHTFATTVTLTNGVPIESVSKMLGHKNLRTTQHYAKVLDKKVSEDMNILRQKFQLKTATKAKKAQ